MRPSSGKSFQRAPKLMPFASRVEEFKWTLLRREISRRKENSMFFFRKDFASTAWAGGQGGNPPRASSRPVRRADDRNGKKQRQEMF